MLTDDILVEIYRHSSLETCIALSEVCRSSYAVWTALDTFLVRQKVQERVPWFSLGGGFSSWKKCALAAVFRTKKALNGDTKLIKSMAVLLSESTNKVEYVSSVDISREARESMVALFDERVETTAAKYAVFEGTKLLTSRTALDMTTMKISKTDYDKWIKPKAKKLSNTAVTESGVEVVSTEEIEVVDENETFILVRFLDESEELIKKTGLDKYTTSSNRVHKTGTNTGLINLLPQKGAIMFKVMGDNSTLVYLDGTRCLVICNMLKYTQEPYFNIHQRFYVSYQGYFYLFYEGRFQRLWVDLGYTTEYHVLCAWDGFPAIGSFLDSRQAAMEEGVEFKIMQRGRYVGIRGTGRIVGDLKSGKTYFAKDAALADQLAIPFVKEDETVGFYTCQKRVMDALEKKLTDVVELKSRDSDLSGVFEQLCEKDKRGKLRKGPKMKKMTRKSKFDKGDDELKINNQWQVDDFYQDCEWPEVEEVVDKGDFKEIQ